MTASENLSDSDIDHAHKNGHVTSVKSSANHHGNTLEGSSSDEDQISFSYSSDEEFLPDMIKKKKTSSNSKKKSSFPSSPSNKSTPLSEQPPLSPSKTLTPQYKVKAQSTVRSKLSAHKDRNIKTLGDSTPQNMSNTASQSREGTPTSPHAHDTPSHHPQLHSSQLQPSQPHRRFETKKKDDLFSLEKKRRRLSSMNNLLRKNSTHHTPHTSSTPRTPSTLHTPSTPDVGDPRTPQIPSIASKGKTMRHSAAGKRPRKSIDTSDSEIMEPASVKKTSPSNDSSKHRLSSLSDSEDDIVSMPTRQVSSPLNEQEPPSTLWKADGTLISSSDESGKEERRKPKKINHVDRMKSIFGESESDDETTNKVIEPSPPVPVVKHAKVDKVVRKPNKRQVFSDSNSSDDDDVATVKGVPHSEKGNSHPVRDSPHPVRDSPHPDHKAKSIQRNHKPEHSSTTTTATKRPLDRSGHNDDSTAKKLRLVDIDFTGGKMRPPHLSQTKPSSKLTPLKKLRLQSQKGHHGPLSIHSRPKSSIDGKVHTSQKEEHKTTEKKPSVHKLTSPEKSSKQISSTTKDGHHRKNDLFKKSSHDSTKRSHDHVKRSHDSSKKSHDSSGRELFAHKNAILAAKFPQKRNLLSEHS